MKKLRIRDKIVLFLSFVLLLTGGLMYSLENSTSVSSQAVLEDRVLETLGQWEIELNCGQFYNLVDQNGKIIDQTGRMVSEGDVTITEDNLRYEVIRVDNSKLTAVCKLVGKEDIVWEESWDSVPALQLAEAKNNIGVYMTHSDESYVPTDGKESQKAKGGILKVGKKLTEALKNKGVNAIVSLNTHDPHDANAYHRSRKTAAQLLKQNTAALIDVHRDGIPDPNYYKTNLNGKPATKIKFVVGRQNPHHSANLSFAKKMKAYYDKKYPGLIKGIFIAKGNYNQDLSPQAMLLEVGTYTNKREEAELGVATFAAGLPSFLNLSTVSGKGAPTKGSNKSLIGLLVVALVGGGAFLFISTGSVSGSLEKISNLGKEFSNYLGPFKRKNKK